MLCYYRIKVQMIGERKRERKEKWTEWMVKEWEGRIRQAPGRRNNRCQLTKNFLPTQTLWIYQINDVSWNVKARWTQCLATLTVNNNNPEKIFYKIPCSIFITFPYSWGCLRFNHSSKKLRLSRQFIKIQLLQICFSLMQTVKIPPKLQTMSSGTSLLSM